MQVSPAKIKVFLGSIKAKLEDENTTEDPSLIFLTLLKMELLLRGVLVEEDDKVYSQILASAGKALLNESFIPKQLLAGANIIAGRMAESFACNRDSFKPDLNASSASLKRAQEIKDKRFIILLQQDFDALEIARGYFSSATCLSPDTPPMWKKLWDVICAQYNDDTPFQSQLAIENLIRIADLKGNSKRSTELKLKLIQCYLNKDTRDPESGGKKNTSIIFGDVTLAKLPTDAKEVAELAKGVVQEFNLSDLTDSDKILYGILKLRVEMSLESAIIEQMAEDQISNDINRSKRSTIHDVRIECKQRVFARADAILQQVSLELRDSLLLVWSNNNSAHLLLCLEWTKKAVLRLKDRAEVTKKQENWDILYQYILKIIHAIIKKCDWSLQMPRNDRRKNIAKWLGLSPKEEICLVSTIVTIFPTVYWMMLEMDTEPLDEIFRLLDDVLFVLQQQVIQTGERLSSILTSKSKVPTEKTLWKQAQAMVTCFICQDDRDTIFHVTREAVTYKRGECHGVLGVLQCLVAWSGWFQNPWAFCSNISDVRRLLAAARADSGRPLTILEEMLLDLAGADAELLQGGFPKDAGKVYLKVLTGLKMADKMEEGLIVLLRAHCNNGLARVCQLEIDMEGQMSVEEFAQQTLNALDNDHHISRLQIWHKPDTISASFVRKLSTARQLIADYLVMEGRCEEAREFLQAAVNDSPLDSSAAFALGSFLLKMAFYGNEGRSQEADKGAQIQLLKSAKLDSTKSNPFALLGFWFEEQGDIPRAKRCYSKSLALDPCNPVSGRGVLRLGAYEDAQTHIEQAIDENSSQNGWAWQAVGLNKVLRGEDDLAIVALLKALRCRDIIQTSNEPLGIFYQSQRRMINEQASVLEETGHCYRRLGRYTAAIRAFHAAIDSYREGTIPSSVLCSCAQVELELALIEDSAEKFARVLQNDKLGDSNRVVATYGHGIALLALATRDLQDGKAGSALISIQKAIRSCLQVSGDFVSIQKLLGDLYLFGASIPSTVFIDKTEQSELDLVKSLNVQLDFVSQGEEAYRSALKVYEAKGEGDGYKFAGSSTLCDVASNILCQAQILLNLSEIDDGITNTDEVYRRAATEFENAIRLNPLHAAAWCGLGCAVKDPLLAQHAFCRCLQIERMLPDGYANVGFLYTDLGAFVASEGTMDALTQVADTPMMWINRAFILERKAITEIESQSSQSTQKIAQAADAYRAALQVMKQPDAMIGLAVTGRVQGHGLRPSMKHSEKRKESSSLLKEFLATSPHLNREASLLNGIMAMEQSMEIDGLGWNEETFLRGKQLVESFLDNPDESEWSINTDAIAICIDEVDVNPIEIESKPPVSLRGIKKQILEQPDRPDLWLSLAKGIVNTLLDDGDRSQHAIESAYTAACRASSMLTKNLTRPHLIDGYVTALVKPEMISESLSMVYFLRKLRSDKDENDDKMSNYNLQRSLMMCPNNMLAREAVAQPTQ